MIKKKELYQDRLFSDYLDELEERAFCEGYEYAQREFGAQSKVLGYVSPGAYLGKELAKLESNDEDEYQERRNKAALKGHLAPLQTSVKYRKALKMAKAGATPDEIRKEVGSATTAALIGENIIPPLRWAGQSYGYYKGLSTMDDDKRLEAKRRVRGKWGNTGEI